MTWSDLQRPEMLPEVLLATVVLVLALLDALLWPRRASRAGAYAALFGMLMALAAALQAWDRPWWAPGLWLARDPGAAFADVLILTGAVLAALLAAARAGRPQRAGTAILVPLATLGGMVAVGARDLVTLFVGLELAALSLLAYEAVDPRLGRRAALRHAGPMGAATAFTALGIACLWSAGGPPELASLTTRAAGASDARIAAGAALLLAGLALRAGVVPFHLWLADTTIGCAPSAAMLGLSAGIIPALLVITRLADGLFGAALPAIDAVLLSAGLLTAIVGALLAMTQRRLRRFLAYASIAHIGFALGAAGATAAGGGVDVPAGVWLLLAGLLPAAAGCLAIVALRGEEEGVVNIQGLARHRPAEGALLCLFLLALGGLPPTLAFAGRGALWTALLTGAASNPITVAFLAAALLLAVAAVRLALTVVVVLPAPGPSVPVTAEAVTVVVLSAAALLLFGLWPVPIAQAASLAAGAG